MNNRTVTTCLIAALSITFSAYSAATIAATGNAAVSNATTNEKAVSKMIPAQDSPTETIAGQLQTGKTNSVIVYVGMESGDYAVYCFANKSAVGRAILAKCKNGDQCEFVGEVADDDEECTAPGLEASVSRSGNITKVTRVKRLKRPTR